MGFLVTLLWNIYGWSLISIVCIVFFFIELALLIFTFPVDRQRKIVGRLFRLSSVITCKLMPIWDYEIYGEVPTNPTSTIFVSNHRGFGDSMLLSFLPWEMKYLVKKSMILAPFVGWSMLLAGDIPVSRGNPTSAKVAMKKCAEYLKNGMNVLIYPEGTRSKSGELGEFKKGAFQLAIDTQCDIVPVAVAGTEYALKVGSISIGPSKARVKVGKPISTKGKTIQDLETLKEQVRKEIDKMYSEILPLTGPR